MNEYDAQAPTLDGTIVKIALLSSNSRKWDDMLAAVKTLGRFLQIPAYTRGGW